MKLTQAAPVTKAPGGISVVVPVFNEVANLDELHRRLAEVRASMGRRMEIILVDDGSTDGSTAELARIAAKDDGVVVVRLARNFGQTAALAAGIDQAGEEIVVTLDADLQNDPADIPKLLAEMEKGADVVSGWRKDRHDAWLTRIVPSVTANWLISRITGVNLHDHGCTLKAYRRQLFDSFRLYGEMHRFVPVHAAWAGAKVVEVEVRHHARKAGVSKYGLGRTWKVVLDLMTIKFLLHYGSRPLHVFGSIGIVACMAGVLSGVVTLVQRALDHEAYVHRNPLILLAIFLFLIGMQCIMMGLLAEIGIRTHHEVRGGRAYVVAAVIRSGAPGAAGTAAGA